MTIRTILGASLTTALLGATLAPTLVPALAVAADAAPIDGGWHRTLTPYLWLPNVNADLSHDFARLQTEQDQVQGWSKQLPGESQREHMPWDSA